ncbi:hypothetical protein RND71_040879 [Anisodus tanguticus]|uniref:Uncharacterized protein n=1 Tax=Anisodus tanguticus TaxID=243964 RepID=A0AAE1QWC7_9SOLA|nr:hypothetical protein RND71_040879 [Anisodus tanguticus]
MKQKGDLGSISFGPTPQLLGSANANDLGPVRNLRKIRNLCLFLHGSIYKNPSLLTDLGIGFLRIFGSSAELGHVVSQPVMEMRKLTNNGEVK